jgi:hypothetical protein
VFFQYIEGYERSFTNNGPFNVLAVLTINTGYFEDRLQPALTLVYDFGSNSAAMIPQVTYRYTSSFSATVGLAFFEGRQEPRQMALYPTVLERTGRGTSGLRGGGLGSARPADLLKIRYTF